MGDRPRGEPRGVLAALLVGALLVSASPAAAGPEPSPVGTPEGTTGAIRPDGPRPEGDPPQPVFRFQPPAIELPESLGGPSQAVPGQAGPGQAGSGQAGAPAAPRPGPEAAIDPQCRWPWALRTNPAVRCPDDAAPSGPGAAELPTDADGLPVIDVREACRPAASAPGAVPGDEAFRLDYCGHAEQAARSHLKIIWGQIPQEARDACLRGPRSQTRSYVDLEACATVRLDIERYSTIRRP
ncbi:hypothetical protein [Methylobacterium sp. A54F]